MKDESTQTVQLHIIKKYDEYKDLFHYTLYLIEGEKAILVDSGYNLKKILVKEYQILD